MSSSSSPAATPAAAAPAAASPAAAPPPAATPSAEALRAALEQFALQELVRQHRTSFPPLWSVESWAKLLIWLALNSGCPTDNLPAFAAALDPHRSARLRQLFFSREREAEGLRLEADPAEAGVRITELAGGGAQENRQGLLEGGAALSAEAVARIGAVLAQEGLAERVEPQPQRWQRHLGGVVVPWR